MPKDTSTRASGRWAVRGSPGPRGNLARGWPAARKCPGTHRHRNRGAKLVAGLLHVDVLGLAEARLAASVLESWVTRTSSSWAACNVKTPLNSPMPSGPASCKGKS
eukprot:15445576-Alexandrium_andersonii.AAC.8